MCTVCMRKQLRVPVHVDDVIEIAQAVIVDPKDAIVKRLCTLGVVIQKLAHLRSPVNLIQLRVISFPPQVRPRVLQHEQTLSLKCT